MYRNLSLCCSESHNVGRRQAKVDDDGGEGEEVSGTIVFMHPTAQLLQRCRSPLELFSQGQQQQQNIGKQKDWKLEEGRKHSAEEEQQRKSWEKRERSGYSNVLHTDKSENSTWDNLQIIIKSSCDTQVYFTLLLFIYKNINGQPDNNKI